MTSPEHSCAELLATMRTLQLSTVGDDGSPHCGYAPYLYQAPCSLYVFISPLAVHTRDIAASGKAAVLIMQDEADSKQIFARTRVSYQCQCNVIPPADSSYDKLLDAYQQRQGKMVGLLRQLPDFQLYHLRAVSGQFVMGFGKAYHLTGENLEVFEHARSA